jgi:protein SCO1
MCILFVLATLCLYAAAQINSGVMSPPANTRPPRLQNVGIDQHLDAQVPADLLFRDETGKTVRLGDYFGRKPLIMNLVYYNCTMLCGEALAGLASAMRLVKFDVGKEFDVIIFQQAIPGGCPATPRTGFSHPQPRHALRRTFAYNG